MTPSEGGGLDDAVAKVSGPSVPGSNGEGAGADGSPAVDSGSVMGSVPDRRTGTGAGRVGVAGDVGGDAVEDGGSEVERRRVDGAAVDSSSRTRRVASSSAAGPPGSRWPVAPRNPDRARSASSATAVRNTSQTACPASAGGRPASIRSRRPASPDSTRLGFVGAEVVRGSPGARGRQVSPHLLRERAQPGVPVLLVGSDRGEPGPEPVVGESDDLVAARHVRVQRRGGDAEPVGHRLHRQRVESDGDGGVDDVVPPMRAGRPRRRASPSAVPVPIGPPYTESTFGISARSGQRSGTHGPRPSSASPTRSPGPSSDRTFVLANISSPGSSTVEDPGPPGAELRGSGSPGPAHLAGGPPAQRRGERRCIEVDADLVTGTPRRRAEAARSGRPASPGDARPTIGHHGGGRSTRPGFRRPPIAVALQHRRPGPVPGRLAADVTSPRPRTWSIARPIRHDRRRLASRSGRDSGTSALDRTRPAGSGGGTGPSAPARRRHRRRATGVRAAVVGHDRRLSQRDVARVRRRRRVRRDLPVDHEHVRIVAEHRRRRPTRCRGPAHDHRGQQRDDEEHHQGTGREPPPPTHRHTRRRHAQHRFGPAQLGQPLLGRSLRRRGATDEVVAEHHLERISVLHAG